MRRRIRPLSAALTCAVLAAGAWASAPVSPSTATSTVTAAQAADGPAVPILLYHHVATGPARGRQAPLFVSPALFRRQLAALADAGYEAVTLAQVWRAWRGGDPLPARPVVVSFDDGYADQYRAAYPVLKARGWPGVLNLIARNRFKGPITVAQVRGLLAAGWELDSHTVTHPDLTKVRRSTILAEMVDSRRQLQARYGAPVDFLAYPYGHVDARVAQAVREAGYLGATTTEAALASPASDPARLPRVIVGSKTSGPALVAKLDGLKARR